MFSTASRPGSARRDPCSASARGVFPAKPLDCIALARNDEHRENVIARRVSAAAIQTFQVGKPHRIIVTFSLCSSCRRRPASPADFRVLVAGDPPPARRMTGQKAGTARMTRTRTPPTRGQPHPNVSRRWGSYSAGGSGQRVPNSARHRPSRQARPTSTQSTSTQSTVEQPPSTNRRARAHRFIAVPHRRPGERIRGCPPAGNRGHRRSWPRSQSGHP